MLSKLRSFLFYNSGIRQTIVKNIFWLGMTEVGSRLIRAVLIIYAARILGATEYGIFAYVLGFAAFFTLFADLGLNPLLTREISRTADLRYRMRYFSTSFVLKLIFLSFTVLIIVFLAPRFTNIAAAAPLIPLMAFVVFADGVRDFGVSYLRGIERMQTETFIVTLMNTAIMAVGMITLFIAPDAHSLLVAYIIGVGFSALLTIFILRSPFISLFSNFDFSLIRPILHSVWPIVFTGFFGLFVTNVDIIMLGWWYPPEEIGYYSASQRIVQILSTLPALITTGAFPLISRLIKEQNTELLSRLTTKFMSIFFLISLPIAVGGFLLAAPIITFVYGASYIFAAVAFQILILNVLFSFPTGFLNNFVLGYDKQKRLILFVAMSAVLSFLLNLSLIPRYGMQGASLALLISQSFYFFAVLWYVRGIIHFPFLSRLFIIAFATFIMGLVSLFLFLLHIPLLLIILFSILVYGATLLYLREPVVMELIQSSKKFSFLLP